MKTFARAASLALSTALLAGCGFKGDLVLPDETSPAVDPAKDADATDVKKNPDT